MDPAQHIRILQLTYAAQLADSVVQYEKAGALERVTEERRAMRLANGTAQAAQMGIAEPAAAFTTSAELFGCADWTVAVDGAEGPDAAGGLDRAGTAPMATAAAPAFTATAHACLLCAMVKKAGGPSPCRLYCLDPIEAMVRGLSADARFDVEETLYDGAECRVRVSS
ncbi:MAG TPA: hypothetical protein VLA35_05335 [Thermoleophilia bacterium]|nr:hypothetical protein [Thermoleophilia bacterium]